MPVDDRYWRQVALLVRVLPFVAEVNRVIPTWRDQVAKCPLGGIGAYISCQFAEI